ncbi:MAG: hypothetical protein KKH72_12430, partial [Alphaproteobacteria bacterium]|nr:hypothetical protein [Alphaproteobacteria bacterium]
GHTFEQEIIGACRIGLNGHRSQMAAIGAHWRMMPNCLQRKPRNDQPNFASRPGGSIRRSEYTAYAAAAHS